MIARAVDVAQIVAVAVVGDRAELLVDHHSEKPMMALSGVRISWLMRARKSVFCDDARSATARACVKVLFGPLPLRDVAHDGAEAAVAGQPAMVMNSGMKRPCASRPITSRPSFITLATPGSDSPLR